MSCVSEYRFKYFDISDEIKFKVLLISNPVSQQELWGLEVYKNKEPFFTHIIKTEPIGSQLDPAFRMTQLEFQDLPDIESVMKVIIENRYDFNDGHGSCWFYKYD